MHIVRTDREVLQRLGRDVLRLIQRLLYLEVALTIQVGGFHIGQTVSALRHRQQQQVCREKGVFLNLQNISHLSTGHETAETCGRALAQNPAVNV